MDSLEVVSVGLFSLRISNVEMLLQIWRDEQVKPTTSTYWYSYLYFKDHELQLQKKDLPGAVGAIGGGRDVAQTPCPGHVRDVVLDHVVLLCLGLGRTGSPWRNRLIPLLESALPGRWYFGQFGPNFETKVIPLSFTIVDFVLIRWKAGAASGYVDFKVLISSLRTVAERLALSSGMAAWPGDVDRKSLSNLMKLLKCASTTTRFVHQAIWRITSCRQILKRL